MKRVVPAVLIGLFVVVLIAIFATGSSNDGYRVRAIFDSAFGLSEGQDVKVAGVRVGSVQSLDVQPGSGYKAAVVLKIDNKAFQDFRQDARCQIRLQSLIGERFVECTPSEPRAEGEPQSKPLAKIPSGEPGAGELLLPVNRTYSPVDLDLIQNTMRRPYRERLAIIINELGTGLAGRGKELKEAIHRSNPALEQTDRVLKELANQNQTLAKLVSNSEQVTSPLAAKRKEVASSIQSANQTASAIRSEDQSLDQSISALPGALRELRPTMNDLGDLSEELQPGIADLRAAAPNLSTAIVNLGPFSQKGERAIETLGDAAKTGDEAIDSVNSTVSELQGLTRSAAPVTADLDELTASLENTGALPQILDTLFNVGMSMNVYDRLGYLQRVLLIADQCVDYAVKPAAGCSSNFIQEDAASTDKDSGLKLLSSSSLDDPTASDENSGDESADPALDEPAPTSADPDNSTFNDGIIEGEGLNRSEQRLLSYLLGTGGSQ